MQEVNRVVDILLLLANLAYEGSNVDLAQIEKRRKLEGKGLIRDEWVYALMEDMIRDLLITASYYECKLDKTRAIDVYQWRKSQGEAV